MNNTYIFQAVDQDVLSELHRSPLFEGIASPSCVTGYYLGYILQHRKKQGLTYIYLATHPSILSQLSSSQDHEHKVEGRALSCGEKLVDSLH